MKRARRAARLGGVASSELPWAPGPRVQQAGPQPSPTGAPPQAGSDISTGTPREVGGHGRTWGRGSLMFCAGFSLRRGGREAQPVPAA